MKCKPKKCVAMALENSKPVEPSLTIESDGKVEPMAQIRDEVYAGKETGPMGQIPHRYLLESLKEDKAEELLL